MKKMRKQLTWIMALMLIFALNTSVFAAVGEDEGEDTVTGDGTTEYIDLEIYSVVLPTGKLLDFTLDPQGLLAIGLNEKATLDELKGGTIVPANGAVKAINNSAVDIALSIELTGTGEDVTFIEYGDDAETTIANVEADDGNNVLLYAAPSAVNIVSTETQYSAAGKGYIITDDPSTLQFVLKAAEYEIENNDGVYTADAIDNTGSGTAIQLGGYVNTKADWNDYVKELEPSEVGISVVFSYRKATDDESKDTGVTGIPGLLSSTDVPALTLTPPAPERGFINGESATNGGTLTVTKSSNLNYDIDFNFAEKTITDVRSNGSTLNATFYEINTTTNKLKIKGSWSSAGDKTITFKLDDDGDTTYTVLLRFV
ncbi:MAG: hypothetical protein LBL26_03030 [Peptococcaceae bacterium]|nr:hypothetical protein [Peptococcaceae bacterium]